MPRTSVRPQSRRRRGGVRRRPASPGWVRRGRLRCSPRILSRRGRSRALGGGRRLPGTASRQATSGVEPGPPPRWFGRRAGGSDGLGLAATAEGRQADSRPRAMQAHGQRERDVRTGEGELSAGLGRADAGRLRAAGASRPAWRPPASAAGWSSLRFGQSSWCRGGRRRGGRGGRRRGGARWAVSPDVPAAVDVATVGVLRDVDAAGLEVDVAWCCSRLGDSTQVTPMMPVLMLALLLPPSPPSMSVSTSTVDVGRLGRVAADVAGQPCRARRSLRLVDIGVARRRGAAGQPRWSSSLVAVWLSWTARRCWSGPAASARSDTLPLPRRRRRWRSADGDAVVSMLITTGGVARRGCPFGRSRVRRRRAPAVAVETTTMVGALDAGVDVGVVVCRRRRRRRRC